MQEPIDILLVDDEPRNLDALEVVLTDPAYRLLRAPDADTALHLLLRHDVAAIVLDILMPGVSGIELAGMIKRARRFQRIPIVFLTALELEDQHVIAGYDVGAVDYLTKPVNPQILRQKVAVFAELFRKTRELAELNELLEQRVRDRTAELERSQAALQASAHQKDDFIAVLAHELHNPLAPLRMGLDLLLQTGGLSAQGQKTLAAMNRQLDHLVRLMDDLLDISRISRGRFELRKEVADLRTIVEAAIAGARPFFDRRQQGVAVDLGGPVEALVDSARVVQILTNLLHNAAKFTAAGGRIEVKLTCVEDRAFVRVIDCGAGIAPEELERIFGMFGRVKRAGAGEPGLGIGLAIARGLAEMHEGTLTALSAGEGCGATFTLSLPARTGTQQSSSDPAPTPRGATGSGLKVLIIEDNPDVSDTLQEWLEVTGHQAWLARTGQQGIDLVHEARPDVVLCDLGLPEMDGIAVCRAIRSLPTDIQPVMVALTGWGREEDRRRTREAGFDHHLVKPVAPDNLRAVLGSVPG